MSEQKWAAGMSNIDRAAAILHRHHDNCNDAADALAAAGVLAPDLPEPTWEHTGTWLVDDLEVDAIGSFVHLEWPDETDDMRGTTARSLTLDRRMVLAILAAADRAKEEQ